MFTLTLQISKLNKGCSIEFLSARTILAVCICSVLSTNRDSSATKSIKNQVFATVGIYHRNNDFFLLYKVAEISSHGEYSYYGSIFIAFEIFPNHNYC
jgi:hypothetical protein